MTNIDGVEQAEQVRDPLCTVTGAWRGAAGQGEHDIYSHVWL